MTTAAYEKKSFIWGLAHSFRGLVHSYHSREPCVRQEWSRAVAKGLHPGLLTAGEESKTGPCVG